MFNSDKGKVPEVDVTKLDNITSLVTTFEKKEDLITRNIMNFLYDRKTDYVFIDFWSFVNGERQIDFLVGYDKEKIITVCENILKYFRKIE